MSKASFIPLTRPGVAVTEEILCFGRNTSHLSMEKLTHDFTNSLHDNHPLIACTETLLQWECDRTVKWNQWCVVEEAPVRRMGVCAHMCWNGKCRHAFDVLTLRQVTQVYCASEHSFSSILCTVCCPLLSTCSLLRKRKESFRAWLS